MDRPNFVRVLLVAWLLIPALAWAQSGDSPQTSHDGLVLKEKNSSTELWVRPGASLAQYDKVALLECPVAFSKDWQRDQNDDVVDPMNMVTKQDMDRIKTALSDEFKEVFTQVLQKAGYSIVDYGAEDVLIVRPAIINLDVAAPDNMTPGMSQTFVASAGSMTLYVELYDSVHSQILARYVNAAGDMGGFVEVANRVTNKAAADRILTRWADRLVKGLNDAHKATGATPPSAKQ